MSSLYMPWSILDNLKILILKIIIYKIFYQNINFDAYSK